MTSQTINDIKQTYVEWNVDNVISFIDQILKSPDMIAGTNQISPTDISKIKVDQKKIATKALEKEADFLIQKYKINTADDLISPPKNVSEKDIVKVLCKYCGMREPQKGSLFCGKECEYNQTKIVDKYSKKETANSSWYKK
jgi:hypothetical protein